MFDAVYSQLSSQVDTGSLRVKNGLTCSQVTPPPMKYQGGPLSEPVEKMFMYVFSTGMLLATGGSGHHGRKGEAGETDCSLCCSCSWDTDCSLSDK